jgi:hypothetical protein
MQHEVYVRWHNNGEFVVTNEKIPTGSTYALCVRQSKEVQRMWDSIRIKEIDYFDVSIEMILNSQI